MILIVLYLLIGVALAPIVIGWDFAYFHYRWPSLRAPIDIADDRSSAFLAGLMTIPLWPIVGTITYFTTACAFYGWKWPLKSSPPESNPK